VLRRDHLSLLFGVPPGGLGVLTRVGMVYCCCVACLVRALLLSSLPNMLTSACLCSSGLGTLFSLETDL
jgi:hypothetical protein